MALIVHEWVFFTGGGEGGLGVYYSLGSQFCGGLGLFVRVHRSGGP